MLLLGLKSQKDNPKMKSLMSLRYAWSVVGKSIPKIKILEKKGVDKHDDPNMKECVPEKIQSKTNQEIEKPEGIENH